MGISQHVHGTDNARCLIALALVDRPGRPARHRAASAARPEQRAGRLRRRADPDVLSRLPAGRTTPTCASRSRSSGSTSSIRSAGLTVVEIMNAIHAGEITRHVYRGREPGDVRSRPAITRAQALAKLDHLVVQDLFLTETAFHADVILPASAFAEKSGTFTNTDRRVQLARPVLKPPGDARQDLWIIQEIAQRMGLHWNYAGPAEVFAEMAQVDAVAEQHHLGAAGARRRGDLSGRRAGHARQRHHLHRRASRPRAGAARSCRRDVLPPDEVPDDEYPMVLSTGPRAGALAHRLDDAARRRARCRSSPRRSRSCRRRRCGG